MKILNVDQLYRYPKPTWLVEPLLPRKSLGVLYGRPKCGKSLWSLDLSLNLAKDGHNILYMAGEGLGSVGARLRSWMKTYGAWWTAGAETPLYFTDSIPNLMNKGGVIDFLDAVFKGDYFGHVEEHRHEWTDEEGEEHHELELEHVHECDLIVVDTLSRAMAGADENDAMDMSRAIEALDWLRSRLNAAVLVVHHTPKDDSDMERGSGALRGAADIMLKMKRGNGGTSTLTVDASRDSEPGYSKTYKIVQVDESAVLQEAQTPSSREALIRLLEKQPMTQRELMALLQVTQQRISKLGKDLETEGLVRFDNGYYRLVVQAIDKT